MPLSPQEVTQRAQAKQITLRDAVPTDSAALLTVATSAYGNVGNWAANPEDTKHYDQVGQHTLLCTIAEVKGVVAGYVFYKIRHGDLYVSDIAVAKAYQGQGIMDILLAYALAYGHTQNAAKATLYTARTPEGKVMRDTYRRRGFYSKTFGYTTDEDEEDTGSSAMKTDIVNTLTTLEQKI